MQWICPLRPEGPARSGPWAGGNGCESQRDTQVLGPSGPEGCHKMPPAFRGAKNASGVSLDRSNTALRAEFGGGPTGRRK
jgi:hypothetical protein